MMEINHKDSERMVHAFAARVNRRLAALPKVMMSHEDVVQELWIAWCKARDRFDPSRGIPWPAYLHNGMRLHINRMIETHISRLGAKAFAFSLDSTIEGTENATLAEIIPSDDILPEYRIEERSNYREAMRLMSDPAKMFVSILNDQPQELLNEVLVAQDKAEYAAKIGAPFNAPLRITAHMVFNLMGVSQIERTRIRKEVSEIGMRISDG